MYVIHILPTHRVLADGWTQDYAYMLCAYLSRKSQVAAQFGPDDRQRVIHSVIKVTLASVPP